MRWEGVGVRFAEGASPWKQLCGGAHHVGHRGPPLCQDTATKSRKSVLPCRVRGLVLVASAATMECDLLAPPIPEAV